MFNLGSLSDCLSFGVSGFLGSLGAAPGAAERQAANKARAAFKAAQNKASAANNQYVAKAQISQRKPTAANQKKTAEALTNAQRLAALLPGLKQAMDAAEAAAANALRAALREKSDAAAKKKADIEARKKSQKDEAAKRKILQQATAQLNQIGSKIGMLKTAADSGNQTAKDYVAYLSCLERQIKDATVQCNQPSIPLSKLIAELNKASRVTKQELNKAKQELNKAKRKVKKNVRGVTKDIDEKDSAAADAFIKGAQEFEANAKKCIQQANGAKAARNKASIADAVNCIRTVLGSSVGVTSTAGMKGLGYIDPETGVENGLPDPSGMPSFDPTQMLIQQISKPIDLPKQCQRNPNKDICRFYTMSNDSKQQMALLLQVVMSTQNQLMTLLNDLLAQLASGGAGGGGDPGLYPPPTGGEGTLYPPPTGGDPGLYPPPTGGTSWGNSNLAPIPGGFDAGGGDGMPGGGGDFIPQDIPVSGGGVFAPQQSYRPSYGTTSQEVFTGDPAADGGIPSDVDPYSFAASSAPINMPPMPQYMPQYQEQPQYMPEQPQYQDQQQILSQGGAEAMVFEGEQGGDPQFDQSELQQTMPDQQGEEGMLVAINDGGMKTGPSQLEIQGQFFEDGGESNDGF